VVSEVNPAYAKLGLVDIMGTIHVAVEMINAATSEVTTYVFNEADKVWWEWVDSDATGLIFTTRGIASNFLGRPFLIRGNVLGLRNNAQYTISGATINESGSTIVLDYISKDPDQSAYTALYLTPLQDLERNNWKHLKFIDAIGDYGTNTISLSWTKHADWSNWSTYMDKTPSGVGYDHAARWYNLGHARRFALRVKFSGNDQIAHEAFEVGYNIMTQ
jgi:hypothetical protein